MDYHQPEKHLLKYEYSKLDGKDIRLVNLLPGQSLDDPLHITISHAPLAPPARSPQPPALWTREELQKTLSEGWKVYRTLDEAFLFENERTLETSWSHPDPAVDPIHYHLPEDYPYPDFMPKYEALSYSWGELKQEETLYIQTTTGTQYLEIGLNLAVVLQHLRYEDTPRSLWIDAICINQKDLEERSRQVRRMASIYKMAYRVVVWLGPESADSNLALSAIEKLGSRIECNENLSEYFLVPGCKELASPWKELSASLKEEHWESLDNLLQRSWFSRGWVIQEIRMANRRAIVYCGRDHVKWNYFPRAFSFLWEEKLPYSGIRYRLSHTRKLMGKISSQMVAVLLYWSANSNCSDPRDKVYAILGITDPKFSQKIIPQYSLPTTEVYKDATLAHIQLFRKLTLLQQCSIYSLVPELPTWVPNWSQRLSSTLFEKRLNNASGLSSCSTLFFAPNILEVVGIKCVGVAEVQNLDKIHQFLDLMIKNRDVRSAYLTGESMARAILASLMANRSWERLPGIPSLPYLEELEKALFKDYSCLVKSLGDDPHFIHRYSDNRAFFWTIEGYIGIGPKEMQPELDIICVLLGCNLPIVLRPTARGQFQVVGECYVHGLSDAEALLGPLPKDWEIEIHVDSANGVGWPIFVRKPTDTRTWQDPRLPRLPPGWEGIPHPELSSGTTGPLFNRFKSTITNETTEFDPRLSPEALEERGVKLQRFQLI
ncbi:HET-domain-containing protein [Hyaloscypha variabilis F]|uniref:HET-domain-containing protein n=1 Tax=Hyaloscypha variabilis (strain UAMH 11265 / GT02V1 / F) TaxID=1149755 RepID=A0A2J6R7F7_HYAVF|nr:HET-domain-containing protein [Hyaloscypha variabilis F]